MKKLLSLLASALLLVWMVLPGSADDKKTAAPAAKAPAADAAPPPGKPAESKPAQAAMPAAAIETKSIPDNENSCIQCHTSPDVWDPKDPKTMRAAGKFPLECLKNDVHWQRGLRCQDCHGGDATNDDNPVKAHHGKNDFHAIKSPADIPDFCGRCHSKIEYMRRFNPSPRTDQLEEYWTSGHGKHLKATGDPKVATCISCHDMPHGNAADLTPHGIRAVNLPTSPVSHLNVAKTCAKCHSDPAHMAGYTYNKKQLPGDEYAKWRKSVHGTALLDKGDFSAPTCNNCHGNHGAAPPQLGSVVNACGTCHGKIATLFENTKMRHKFETERLPGCATCHGNHEIHQPTDDFLGMQNGAFCVRCHEPGKEQHGATIAGAKTAETIHIDLQHLKNGIHTAEETLAKAEELGMEVSVPKYNLHKALDSLTNARTMIHSFQADVVQKALASGEDVVQEVQGKADEALAQYRYRRIWLAVSLVPILIVIGLLLLYIRCLPAAERAADSAGDEEIGK